MNGSNLPRYALFAITCLFVVFACQKDIKETLPSPPGSQSPDKLVTTGFQGRVLDESGKPVEGATAKSGGKTALTDEYGIFRIADAKTSEQFAFVSVEKAGYFKGSRTVIANADAVNFVEIQLMPKKLAGKFSAANAAKIDLENNSAVAFQSGSVVTKNGVAYSGNVNVYSTTIDPTGENFTSIMPGDLRGIRTDSSITALISYGMIAVTLTDDAGEELQLNKTKPAVISMTIPASLQAGAPTEIPLWHFDETDGKWKEEGKAVKQGNTYSGEVSHFSIWNYDVPQDFVFITLNVGGPEGSSAPYMQVKITDKQNGSFAAVFTDSSGYLRTWVPKNAPLEISIVNSCKDILFKKEVGPFTEDAQLERIEIQSNKMIVISGEAVDCENKPIASGYVNLYAKGLFYRGEINEGKFSIIMVECNANGDNAELYAVDYETNQRGETIHITLDASDIDAGVLSACGDEMTEQYAYFTIRDERYDLVITTDTLSFSRLAKITNFSYAKFPNNNGQTMINIKLTDTVPATYTNPELYCMVNDTFFVPAVPLTLTCVKYGQPGGFIELNFSGMMSDDGRPSVPFSGAIRTRREY